MYPVLEFKENEESLRRVSETFEKMPTLQKGSNLEKNCNQIFIKGPAFTKSIIDKMQKDIGPSRTRLFGREFKTRQFWVLAGLGVLFLMSLLGAAIFWGTNTFDNILYSNMGIVKDTPIYDIWVKPTPKAIVKFYIFNYTNVNEFMEKGEKLKVKEIGPYTYEETVEKVNPVFSDNFVTYQEKRTYKFLPELSNGRQMDQVTFPNVPLLSAAAIQRFSNFFARLALSSFFNGLEAKPFLTKNAHSLILGYEDNLYTLSKSVMRLQNKSPYDKFGLLASKNGLQDTLFTVDTGVDNIDNIGKIVRLNQATDLGKWSTDECNRIDATDGVNFSPLSVKNKEPVRFTQKEMCRALPLEFKEESSILNGKIPTFRYTLPENVFDSPEKSPSNQCYCNMESGKCPLQGVFNTSSCSFGAPTFVSFPHFYNGDERLIQGVDGLSPNTTLHETEAHLHPRMGFAMSGKIRFQLNIQVLKSYGISQLNNFEDEMMLPISWFEIELKDTRLPADFVKLLDLTTNTLSTAETCLKYGTILMALITIIPILVNMKSKWAHRSRTSSMRPLQRRETV